MSNRRKHEKTEYEKGLMSYHSLSDRHVLVFETDMLHEDKIKTFHYADLERKAGNELLGLMKKKHDQLMRTKRYRKLKALYGKYKNADNEKMCKIIAGQLNEMCKQHDLTWDFCRKSMIPIGEKYKIGSLFALTKAEDVWAAISDCLFSDGKDLHFKKRGDLPGIRAKQLNRGIILNVENNELCFKFGDIKFSPLIEDDFQKREVDLILKYLKNPGLMDKTAVNTLLEEGTCIDTYRPCYATLVCKKIRGKMRVYLHLTIEGHAVMKLDRNGNPRHSYGKGLIGCDIGTQTIAYTSDTDVGLKNLAERGPSILENERKERLLLRAMDRSKRAMNPDNYNSDGTIRKGRKKWTWSNRYRKLKARHSELCRINAINRHLSINEDVNHIRELGDVFITEPKNSAKLQKRARKTTVNDKGRYNKKKRFGKSIKTDAPDIFRNRLRKNSR